LHLDEGKTRHCGRLYLTNSQSKQTNKKEDNSSISNKKNSFKIEWYNTDNEQLVTRLTNRFYLYSDSKCETSEWIYLFNCVSKLNQINLINNQQQSQETKLKPIIKSQQQYQSDYGLIASRSNSAPNSPTFKRQQITNVKFIDQQSNLQPLPYPQQQQQHHQPQPLYPQQRSNSFKGIQMFDNSTHNNSTPSLNMPRADYKSIYDAFEKPVLEYPLTASLSQQTLNRINDNYMTMNTAKNFNSRNVNLLTENRRKFKSDQNLMFEKNANKKIPVQTLHQSNPVDPIINGNKMSFPNSVQCTYFDR
jgi:hypothetical protein